MEGKAFGFAAFVSTHPVPASTSTCRSSYSAALRKLPLVAFWSLAGGSTIFATRDNSAGVLCGLVSARQLEVSQVGPVRQFDVVRPT